MSLKIFLIVCPLVFLAGFVDAIGGGGGLISLPAYLFAGLPPIQAVATNKLSSSIGTFASTIRYIKNGYVNIKLAVFGVVASLIGAQIGARIALIIDTQIFKTVMIIVLPIIALYVFFKKDFEENTAVDISLRKQIIIITIASFIIGMYDGFYGPGTGTFLLLAYTVFAHMDMLSASGNMKLANLASNLSSVSVFLFSGNTKVLLGLVAAVFCMAGHYTGAGFAIKKGAKGIKFIILIVMVFLMIKIIGEMI